MLIYIQKLFFYCTDLIEFLMCLNKELIDWLINALQTTVLRVRS